MSSVAIAFLAAAALVPAARADDEATSWAEKAYQVSASVDPAPLKPGDKARLHISIRTLLPEAKVHPEAPIKVKLSSPDALKLSKEKLNRADGQPAGKGYQFDLAADALQPGQGQVEATVDFFICSDRWCVKQAAHAVAPVKVCSKDQASC